VHNFTEDVKVRFVGAILRLALAQSLPQRYIRQQNTLPKNRRQTMSLKLHLQTYCLDALVEIALKSCLLTYWIGALVEIDLKSCLQTCWLDATAADVAS
jgi:hypothetical protein